YMYYFPPRVITQSAIQDKNQIDEIIYNSSCLKPGTPYLLYDGAAASRVDGGFSPVIGGRGPPDVYDRYGNEIRGAEKRFQIWFDTGEILCTSNVKQEDDIDRTVGRQNQIVLMDASEYVEASQSPPSSGVINTDSGGQQFPLIFGIGAAIAGIIAFITLRKKKK
ncbi:MAG: LPXTG cell wall anchor domain-containing protein, partial [Nitrososphaera sp.]